MLLTVGFQSPQEVGRDRKIPLFLVFDFEVELRLRPDSQGAGREVNVFPGEVDRLLFAKSTLQQDLENQVQVLVLDRAEESPEFLGRVDFGHRLFELRLGWRQGLHIQLAESQECSDAGMAVGNRALFASALAEPPLVQQNVLRCDFIGECLPYDPQELIGGGSVDGGSGVRASVFSGLHEPVQLACQAQSARNFLDFDTRLLGGDLGLEEMLGFCLGG
ncbi:hypothetical protein SBA5_30258 [Candidatus Sulfotelmatomonas gaucii]|uniref:Uncharacterized protein n=1 Tax=Candidatus Sulfuritelmatomonas gaucii TaxID=2043161 RepID=A0A2N9LCS7_9BACT|nr:hypothetical protein SBA5_30258 [Candidatus Sulfotelmatomonas gaucii]